jgi:hypothetical protein
LTLNARKSTSSLKENEETKKTSDTHTKIASPTLPFTPTSSTTPLKTRRSAIDRKSSNKTPISENGTSSLEIKKPI